MSHGVAFPFFPLALGPFLGPFIIFMGHFAYLLPFYFTLNALILGNRQEAEWIMRSALLKSMVISGPAITFVKNGRSKLILLISTPSFLKNV